MFHSFSWSRGHFVQNMFLACQCWNLEVGENANIYDRFCVHVWRGPEHVFLETKNCANSIVSFTLHSTQKYGKYQGYWLLEVQLCFKTHLVLAHPTPHMIAESGKSLIHIVNYHEILNMSKYWNIYIYIHTWKLKMRLVAPSFGKVFACQNARLSHWAPTASSSDGEFGKARP